MKNFIALLLISLSMIITVNKSEAVPLQQALDNTSSKPAVILVYANWAPGYEAAIRNFRAVQKDLREKYNFVELNIASEEAVHFNSKYYFFTYMPYVFMVRGNGRVTKQVSRNCLSSRSCLADKIKTFVP